MKKHRNNYSYEQRLDIIQEVMNKEISIRGAAQKYHIARDTISKWLRKFELYGPSALIPKEKRNLPEKTTKPRIKHSFEKRLEIVQKVMNKEISLRAAAKEYHVSRDTINTWLHQFKLYGPDGLTLNDVRFQYPEELKLVAVSDYLSGNYSMRTIANKYELKSPNLLLKWINRYNTHEDFKSLGGTIMGKRIKYTQEQRLEIVIDCIDNDYNYKETSEKYALSYQSVYQWVKAYELHGYQGLEDRRGKRKADQTPRSEEEEKDIELARVKKENQELRMELDFVKKLKEIERRRR